MEVFNVKSIVFAVALSSLLSLYNVEATARAPVKAPAEAPAPAVSKEAENAIKNFCYKTDFPSECISSITPLHSGNNVDGHSVLRAGIQALTQRINKAILTFEKRKNDETAKTNDLAERVEVCLAYYRVATTSAKDAVTAITHKDYKQLKEELDRQNEVIGDCDDLFAESVKGHKGPLEDINTALNMLAKNNLALVQNVLTSQ